MDDAGKAARNEYYRKYRKDNPEAIKSYQQRYWERRALAIVDELEQRAAEKGIDLKNLKRATDEPTTEPDTAPGCSEIREPDFA